MNSGCFAGDTAGFPVTVGGSGSYRLTSNPSVSSANITAIVVTAGDVSIDLNGFSISGPTVCTGDPEIATIPPACSPTGTGFGIDASIHPRVRVHDGSIHGMDGTGVRVGTRPVIERLHVEGNGANGIWALQSSRVADNVSVGNETWGIAGDSGSVITGNIAQGNGQIGIWAGIGATVIDNTARVNGSNGFSVGSGSTVTRNSSTKNGATGISTGLACTISHNAVWANVTGGITTNSGSTVPYSSVRENGGTGINAPVASWVSDNAVGFNGGVGLFLGTGTNASGYGNNVIRGNAATVSGGQQVGPNLCEGNSTCP